MKRGAGHRLAILPTPAAAVADGPAGCCGICPGRHPCRGDLVRGVVH